jgi:hypothetical protein
MLEGLVGIRRLLGGAGAGYICRFDFAQGGSGRRDGGTTDSGTRARSQKNHSGYALSF